MGDFRKKCPVDWFRGKKFWQGWIPGEKKFVHWKKCLSWHIIPEKNLTPFISRKKKFYHQRFGEENKILNQITHFPPPPPSKVKWSAPEVGAVIALTCGKIKEYFGFCFKKLSESNSYGGTDALFLNFIFWFCQSLTSFKWTGTRVWKRCVMTQRTASCGAD